MQRVPDWLQSIGLARYADVFEQNAIDFEILPELTEIHLKELDIPLGHRLRILKAITALRPAEATAEAEPAGEQPNISESAERRQLTVMFCDLVASTELARRLDPEDMRTVLSRYQDAVAASVTRYGGHMAKYLGDGVLANFGWPQAHEDQAERAVRAALDAVAAVEQLKLPDGDVSLRARAGIATGEVVIGDLVGEGSHDVEAVTGATPNLAARLQTAAEPGQVVIGATTRQLIGGAFLLTRISGLALKGFSQSEPAWRVHPTETSESRFVATRNAELSAFVGREQELGLLRDRWERAAEGAGNLVLVSGEPGIGKSRFVRAFQDHLEDGTYTRILYQCSPYHINSALYPVARQLERAAGFKADDDNSARLDKLEAALARDENSKRASLALIADLLSLDTEKRFGQFQLTSPQRKELLLTELTDQLQAMVRRRPVLLLVEDAHWIDPTTLQLFDRVVTRLGNQPVLLLMTHRSDWHPPFADHPLATNLSLTRLPNELLRRIVEAIGGQAAEQKLLEHLVERSDGNPLFAEELAKAVTEAPDIAAGFAVPVSLQASFLARLDRLGNARSLVQFAAVLGREFSYRLLAATVDMPEDRLQADLQTVSATGLIRTNGAPPDARYIFKHALAQDAIYHSLLKSQRRSIHARIAGFLESQAADGVRIDRETLAYHYEAAGNLEPAIQNWHLSARTAAANSANTEAAAHCARALALIDLLPESSDRDRRELELLILAGPQQMLSTGLVTREAETIYQHAVALSDRLGDIEYNFQARWGLWHLNEFRAEWGPALGMADVLVNIADKADDDTLRLQACHSKWSSNVFIGELEQTLEYAHRGLELYDWERHRDHAQCYGGHDPGVCAHQMQALIHAVAARPTDANAAAKNGIALADRLGQPASLSMVHFFVGLSRAINGLAEEALHHAETAVEVANRHGILPYAQMGRILRGWARVFNNDVDGGLAELEDLLNPARAKQRKRALLPTYLGLMADAYIFAGRFEDGWRAAEDGLKRTRLQGEYIWESELLRLRAIGMFRDAGVHRADGSALLAQAFDSAMSRGASLLALKAAAALAEVRDANGGNPEAERVLGEASELPVGPGDTPELKRAVAACAAAR